MTTWTWRVCFPNSAFGYLSACGGASLEYPQGKTLPGLAALQDAARSPA